ncbi:transcription factor Adf-1-like [Toxorhynchites rutilus septentrionalis]|uniref:transcription factor Adf-1-like n=1 Tax=Toxorhynchites rutilus septentrionalis TaxID=329112 RepID=UPI00247A8AED|nr:transcription factor Adf-1-like [Toxorhynchites rutilus septentrionalis]
MMDDRALIEMVRQYEELYNMSDERYTDKIHKDNVWRQIAMELGSTDVACKTRWISLRDQFRKTIKKKEETDASEPSSKWKYEDCMSFVLPMQKRRKTLSTRTGLFKSAKRANPEPASPMQLMRYPIGSAKRETTAAPKQDPIDVFFQGLAATVKTFSPEYQHAAKNRLFAVVSDLEWQQLQDNAQNSLPSTPVPATSAQSETPTPVAVFPSCYNTGKNEQE